jgi:hypothetical protein
MALNAKAPRTQTVQGLMLKLAMEKIGTLRVSVGTV